MVSPLNEKSLKLHRVLKAKPELVFDVWTSPEHLMRWFSPSEEITNPFIHVDLREGGTYEIAFLNPDGSQVVVGGTYLSIEKPHKLIFTWAWEDHPEFGSHEMLVTVDILEHAEGTELILTHEKLLPGPIFEEHSRGWNGCLDRLSSVIGEF